mgnify:CR=1 FL=1
MKVGDLVKSSRAHYLVLNVPVGTEQILVQVVKTGERVWLNKSAMKVISEAGNFS